MASQFDGQSFLGSLASLARQRVPLIGPRPDQLCSPCEVLLRPGAAVKLQDMGDEGWAAASRSVSDLKHVHGMQLTKARDGESLSGLLLSFQDTNDGVLEREQLLGRDDLQLCLGNRTVPLSVFPVRARLPQGAVTVSLYRVPTLYMREGFTEALMSAAGYTSDWVQVGEFLGDPPGGPVARRAGSLPNTEVLVLIVVPPAHDPALSALPTVLDMGMGACAHVRVQCGGGRVMSRGGAAAQVRATVSSAECGVQTDRTGAQEVRDVGVQAGGITRGGGGGSEGVQPVGVVPVTNIPSQSRRDGGTGCRNQDGVSNGSVAGVGLTGGGVGNVASVPEGGIGSVQGGRLPARHPVCLSVERRSQGVAALPLVGGTSRVASGSLGGAVSASPPEVGRPTGVPGRQGREVPSPPLLVGSPRDVPGREGVVSSAGWVWREWDEPVREACMLFMEDEVEGLSREVRERICVQARREHREWWVEGVYAVGRPHPLLCDWIRARAAALGGDVAPQLRDSMEWGEGVSECLDGVQSGMKRAHGGGEGDARHCRSRRSSSEWWMNSPGPAGRSRVGGRG